MIISQVSYRTNGPLVFKSEISCCWPSENASGLMPSLVGNPNCCFSPGKVNQTLHFKLILTLHYVSVDSWYLER